MAKIKNPLLSLDAKGEFMGTLTYSHVYGKSVVKRKNRVYNTKVSGTPKRDFSRDFFRNSVAIYHAIGVENSNLYDQKAKGMSMTGFNFFVSDYSYRKPAHAGNYRPGYSRVGVLTMFA
jgi:hypothetical protein